ncbi:MAG: amidohydrolase family protein, partial [Xanthomonadales bacterium]|nr:amidohydrolase family protein [Xanthomonadales bacterium]
PTLDWLCAQGGIAHSDRLWVRSVKLYADGALGSRGAALLNEYSDEPGNRGLLFHEDEALRAQVATVMACGFQVAIHAIGDAANRQALDAIIAVSGQYPDNPGRHRIEHAQLLTDGDLEKFAPLGIIAAVQPTHATSDMYWAEQRLGPDRVQFAYAWRKLVEHGARLALGSDFVVEEVNPMLGFYAAVARSDPEGWPEGGWHPGQRLSRAEALRGFTLDAAYAGFMEDRVGSLAPGKLADMVILDRDIMQVDEDQLPSTLVLETWLGGRRVYHRGAR